MIRKKFRVDRHLRICMEHRCSMCPATDPSVPSGCPVKILHLLEVNRFVGSLRVFGRRTGKTTQVIMEARRAAQKGKKAVILVPNRQQEQYLRETLRREAPNEEIEAISINTPESRLAGRRAKVVLVDEISPMDELHAKKIARLLGAEYKGGMTTSM